MSTIDEIAKEKQRLGFAACPARQRILAEPAKTALYRRQP